jgi:hypothetical protein
MTLDKLASQKLLLERTDWLKLKVALATIVTVVIVFALLILLAHEYATRQKNIFQIQQNLLNAARQHYQSSGEERSVIAEYLPKYKALIQQGFIGEERRIEWIAALHEQHKAHKLFDIKYGIRPRENYQPRFAERFSSIVLHRSVMTLDLDMLHELDILLLTESLASKNISPFMLHDCEITRLNKASELANPLTANLHAKCELDWLTINEPEAPQSLAIAQ